jgi:hypothetical protein
MKANLDCKAYKKDCNQVYDYTCKKDWKDKAKVIAASDNEEGYMGNYIILAAGDFQRKRIVVDSAATTYMIAHKS